jgi:hypothetical protein
VTDRELALRRAIMTGFAVIGQPPQVADLLTLRALADQHVVALDRSGTRVRMAHPFATHTQGTHVTAGGREWWGSCAWDGLGIAAALDLEAATIESGGLTLELEDGALVDRSPVFHVAVPAARWWDDIAFT